MLTLAGLADLAREYADDLALPVAPVRIGGDVFPADALPLVMGCVNLSRDSTYRESIATSASDAVRKGLVLAAQGADIVDIGAESSTAKAARVGVAEQVDRLVPVVEGLVAGGVRVSAETYEPEVARACLDAGAVVLNCTGAQGQEELFSLAAAAGATVVLCYVRGANVREITDVDLDTDPFPGLLEHFAERVEVARAARVDSIVIDPGMGFYYGNLVDPSARVRHQARVIAQTFRLRSLGLPICHALPHAFDLFGEEFRTAEGFFAVLAMLGGTSVLRTHEVARVRAVVGAMRALDVR